MVKSRYDMEARLKVEMTLEEEYAFYNEVLQRVINNPRFYLDHLDELDVFYVSFIDYSTTRRKKRKAL